MKSHFFRTRVVQALVLLAVILPLSVYLYPSRVDMYYGDWSPEENRFDASRWFRNGMYRRDVVNGKVSLITMQRTQPLILTSANNDELVATAIVALESADPEVSGELLQKHWPMLVPRTRYRYSAFAAPDQPQDYYNIYLKYQGERYVITFARDAQTGEIIPGGSVQLMYPDSQTQIADRQVFKELDADGIQ
ncbi:hypothetical protein [Pseudomonas sp. NPDC087817]|uniref:hypothetical protein n=1 Tax=Pseudomonas sp. NPDC087817 TaxID=3364451 RepID=UPI0038048FD1